MCNVKESYLSFKEQKSEELLVFSEFAEVQPGKFVLAGMVVCMHFVCVVMFPSVTFECRTVEDHCREAVMLQERFRKA
jgi:hypothetical protein